jgi:hypothetical protein
MVIDFSHMRFFSGRSRRGRSSEWPSYSFCANHAWRNPDSTRDCPFPDVPEQATSLAFRKAPHRHMLSSSSQLFTVLWTASCYEFNTHSAIQHTHTHTTQIARFTLSIHVTNQKVGGAACNAGPTFLCGLKFETQEATALSNFCVPNSLHVTKSGMWHLGVLMATPPCALQCIGYDTRADCTVFGCWTQEKPGSALMLVLSQSRAWVVGNNQNIHLID